MRFSFVRRLRSSLSHCILLNLGMTYSIMHPMQAINVNTEIAVMMLHSIFLPTIFVMAHIASIGAFTVTCRPMATAIWICVTSFVERVINDDIENLLISSSENFSMLSNCFLRSVADNLAAMYAAMNPHMMDANNEPNAHASILIPSDMTESTEPPVVMVFVMLDIYPGISRSRYTCAHTKAMTNTINPQSFFVRYFRIICAPLYRI